jgi:hypothetical protein
MDLYYGAEHNLKDLIKTHLFIICCTNSGTTFLKEALATSENTWNLKREGQHMFGFAGPNGIGLRAYKLWTTEKFKDTFTDPEKYDWEKIKDAWYFQAYSKNPEAQVFVEKSPPFLMIVDQLIKEFKNAKFLFMVRDPYAVVEGMHRTTWYSCDDLYTEKEYLHLSAVQTINCLKIQKENLGKWGEHGVFFTYEQMCDEPAKVGEMIRELVPELDDLNLRQKLKVKNYHEELRNMNDQQIERLTDEDIEQVNKVFSPYEDILKTFNYSLLEKSSG